MSIGNLVCSIAICDMIMPSFKISMVAIARVLEGGYWSFAYLSKAPVDCRYTTLIQHSVVKH
jgi:hypothetical protein